MITCNDIKFKILIKISESDFFFIDKTFDCFTCFEIV